MVHPKHPKCPHCGKALYKTRGKGELADKSSDWRWCRNIKCPYYFVDQSSGGNERVLKKLWHPGLKKPVKDETRAEGVVVQRLRKKVKKKLNDEASLHYILLIAVVCQEIGYLEFASKLIKRYGLDEAFKMKG